MPDFQSLYYGKRAGFLTDPAQPSPRPLPRGSGQPTIPVAVPIAPWDTRPDPLEDGPNTDDPSWWHSLVHGGTPNHYDWVKDESPGLGEAENDDLLQELGFGPLPTGGGGPGHGQLESDLSDWSTAMSGVGFGSSATKDDPSISWQVIKAGRDAEEAVNQFLDNESQLATSSGTFNVNITLAAAGLSARAAGAAGAPMTPVSGGSWKGVPYKLPNPERDDVPSGPAKAAWERIGWRNVLHDPAFAGSWVHGGHAPTPLTDDAGMIGPDTQDRVLGPSARGVAVTFDPGYVDPTPDGDFKPGPRSQASGFSGFSMETPTHPTNQPGGDPGVPR